MVNGILLIFAFAMGACIYSLFLLFKDREKQKRQQSKPPIRKMEYDCTENFYD